MRTDPVEVELFNRQRTVLVPLPRLREMAQVGVALCRSYAGPQPSLLGELPIVEISFVSDREIARVHRRFMAVPGATDVITFPHGEIVISAVTAARQAALHGETVERELARYIVHGLLHLHGHVDTDARDRAAMWRAQEGLLGRLWPRS